MPCAVPTLPVPRRNAPVMLLVTQHLYAGDAPGLPLEPGQAARVITGASCRRAQTALCGRRIPWPTARPWLFHAAWPPCATAACVGRTWKAAACLPRAATCCTAARSACWLVRACPCARFLPPQGQPAGNGQRTCSARRTKLPQGGIYNISSTLLGLRLRKMGARIAHGNKGRQPAELQAYWQTCWPGATL